MTDQKRHDEQQQGQKAPGRDQDRNQQNVGNRDRDPAEGRSDQDRNRDRSSQDRGNQSPGNQSQGNQGGR
jgi:hypothetical protein